jgi:hypothetical protein
MEAYSQLNIKGILATDFETSLGIRLLKKQIKGTTESLAPCMLRNQWANCMPLADFHLVLHMTTWSLMVVD